MSALGSESFTLRGAARRQLPRARALHPLLGALRRARLRAAQRPATGRACGPRARAAARRDRLLARARLRPRPPLQLSAPSSRLRRRCSPALVACRRASCRMAGSTLLRQVSLFAAAYLAYRIVRGLVAGDADGGLPARARADRDRAHAAPVRRAQRPGLGVGQPLRDGRARAGCTSTRRPPSRSARCCTSTCATTATSTSCATCS